MSVTGRFVRVRVPVDAVDGGVGGDGGDGVGGVALHVVVEGRGPVCVLSAGLAMAWFDWDPVVAPLVAAGRTVVRFDRPGHGLSGPATEPPTTAGEAHRIAGLLDALGLGARAAGPVTVVGHSLAGFHAEAFARLYPERTAALVLVDGSVEESPRTLLPAALRTGAARALGRAVTAAGLPAALGPRPGAPPYGPPAPAAATRPHETSYAAATAPAGSGAAPSWRTPATWTWPPSCGPCAGRTR